MNRIAESATHADTSVDFVWMELTNHCNLKCTHCYAESGPQSAVADLLRCSDYERLITESFELGCRHIQFIGGEPTLNRDLPHLIGVASGLGYDTIEVFTNLVSLPDSLVGCFVANRVSIATSVYAPEPDFHNAVTQVDGSFERTTRNIVRLVQAGLSVRVGVIDIGNDRGRVDATVRYLNELGVDRVGVDRLRHFGRAKDCGDSDLSELCGSCAGNTLCIAPDGRVSPCIMSKTWSVGSVLNSPLSPILRSQRLADLRVDIYHATEKAGDTAYHMGGCNPDRSNPCGPDRGGPCNPCNPNTHCGPNSCKPVR